jgi:AraC-like DNA-binding protein
VGSARYVEHLSRGLREVELTWVREQDAEMGITRVVPDARMDIIWNSRTGALELAGPDTAAFLVEMAPGRRLVGLRFRPGMAVGALGQPAEEVRDLHLPLAELWGREADRLAEAAAGAADPEAELTRAVARRLRMAGPPDPALPALVAALAGGEPVREVAARFGYSDRQLRRRALTAFGYPPKTLQRILRFQRAVRLARRGLPYAEIAQACGYSDQPHLAHDVRALAGTTLTDLVAS